MDIQVDYSSIQLSTDDGSYYCDCPTSCDCGCQGSGSSIAPTPKTPFRVVFEYETIWDSNKPANFYYTDRSGRPLYNSLNDLMDICIKSSQDVAQNIDVPGDLISNTPPQSPTTHMYMTLEDYPVDFCQCNNDAILLTQLTTKSPYMLCSDARLDIRDTSSQSHKFSLQQNSIQTCLYANKANQDRVAAAFQNGSISSVADDFKQYAKVDGVNYNYIVEMDQSQKETIYFNGDVFGRFYLGKNLYNSLYTTQMVSQYQFARCREYCGIIPAGYGHKNDSTRTSPGNIVLKYYDRIRYTFTQVDRSKVDYDYGTTKGYVDGGAYPYQKVEYFIPQNFAGELNGKAKHKSNLFSIKISNSGLDDLYQQSYRASNAALQKTRDALVNRIKTDISNGVKQLVDSIAPANTQLFKTMFV